MDTADADLLKETCTALGIPLQPPVEVALYTKMVREDEDTGRLVEFKTGSTVALSSTPEPQFGNIVMLFTYRANNFVIVGRFGSSDMDDGLVHIKDCTIESRVLVQLQTLPPPLVVARSHQDMNTNQLWILNYNYHN